MTLRMHFLPGVVFLVNGHRRKGVNLVVFAVGEGNLASEEAVAYLFSSAQPTTTLFSGYFTYNGEDLRLVSTKTIRPARSDSLFPRQPDEPGWVFHLGYACDLDQMYRDLSLVLANVIGGDTGHYGRAIERLIKGLRGQMETAAAYREMAGAH